MGAFIDIVDLQKERGISIFPLIDFEISGDEIKFSTVFRKLVDGVFYGVYINQRYVVSHDELAIKFCKVQMAFYEKVFFLGNITDINLKIEGHKAFSPCKLQISEEERAKHLLNHGYIYDL